MTLPLNNCVCLTLDKRIKQGYNIQKSGKKIEIDITLFICGNGNDKDLQYDYIDNNEYPTQYDNSIRYPTWYNRPNALNAWKCHNLIIKNAINNNNKHLLILEDDIIFEKDFTEMASYATPFFINNNWDMIYFGWYSHNHLIPTYNKHVYKMVGGGGFHGVLINNKIMNKLLTFNPIGPYDWICGKYIHTKYDCYAIYPSIITQQDGYSYIEGGMLKKPSRGHK